MQAIRAGIYFRTADREPENPRLLFRVLQWRLSRHDHMIKQYQDFAEDIREMRKQVKACIDCVNLHMLGV